MRYAVFGGVIRSGTWTSRAGLEARPTAVVGILRSADVPLPPITIAEYCCFASAIRQASACGEDASGQNAGGTTRLPSVGG